jgi:hypothetical protein
VPERERRKQQKLNHFKLMRLAMQAMQVTQAITEDDDDDEELRAAALKELENEVEEERGKMRKKPSSFTESSGSSIWD